MSTNVGTTTPVHAGGCGGGPAGPKPTTLPSPGIPAGFVGGGFAIPTFGAAAAVAMPVERFASSMSGGVILGKDGAPAGRIPAGSFVDTKDGTIFGPDGKQLTLPEGATVDFFDLPDIKELVEMNRAATGGGTTKGSGPDAKDHAAMMQSFVDGQWGPGGVTPIKGGGTEGCDMGHAATASGPATKAGGATAVAGASGNPTINSLNAQIQKLMDEVRRITPTSTSGGGATLAASTGAAQLGSIDLLRLSVNDLVGAIGQLNVALADVVRGGGPGQAPVQIPGAPPKVEPPKTSTTPPVVEPPKTETPKTDSSTSGSGSDTTAPASGSGSSSS
jgi:hypothetical protein